MLPETPPPLTKRISFQRIPRETSRQKHRRQRRQIAKRHLGPDGSGRFPITHLEPNALFPLLRIQRETSRARRLLSPRGDGAARGAGLSLSRTPRAKREKRECLPAATADNSTWKRKHFQSAGVLPPPPGDDSTRHRLSFAEFYLFHLGARDA